MAGLKSVLGFMLLFFLLSATPAKAMKFEPHFPALLEFHTALFNIWVEVYPNHDWDALRSALPDLVSKMGALENTQPPEFYQGNISVFFQRLKVLSKAVSALSGKAENHEDPALSGALTAVYNGFYTLVQSVQLRPRELDEFHDVLFLMWHDDYPAKNIKALKRHLPDLKMKMEGIIMAKLGTQFINIHKMDFGFAAVELEKCIEELDRQASAGHEEKTWAELKNIQLKYMMLDRIFD